MVTEDYLYAVNQTYEINCAEKDLPTLAKKEVLIHGKNGIVENLKAIWNEHSDDDWGEFEKRKFARYISGKIALGDASFLTEKQETDCVPLYRLIAERIRQYQHTIPTEQFQMNDD